MHPTPAFPSALLAKACALAIIATAALGLSARAHTLKIANQGDPMSMDPHSLQESFQLAFLGNLYEPLIGRDRNFALTPMLATRWEATSPTTWPPRSAAKPLVPVRRAPHCPSRPLSFPASSSVVPRPAATARPSAIAVPDGASTFWR